MAGVSLHETGDESMFNMINRLRPLKTVWSRSFVQKGSHSRPKGRAVDSSLLAHGMASVSFGAIACSLDAREFATCVISRRYESFISASGS